MIDENKVPKIKMRHMTFSELHEHLHDPANALPREVYEQIKAVTADTNIRMKISAIMESQRHLSDIGVMAERMSVVDDLLFSPSRLRSMKTKDLVQLYSIMGRRHDANRAEFMKMVTDAKAATSLDMAEEEIGSLLDQAEEKIVELSEVDPEKANELLSRVTKLAAYTTQRKAGQVTAPPIVV